MARPPDNGLDYSTDKRFSAWYTLTSLMETIPDALPNLRYLHITPGCYWYPPNMAQNDVLRLIERVFLQQFDAMVWNACEKNQRLEEVHIAAPLDMSSLRLLHRSATVERGPKLLLDDCDHYDDRLWRSIEPKNGDGIAGRERPGYWISDHVMGHI